MPEKCAEPCADLARVEQRLDDLQKRNGEDHKEIRNRLTAIELEDARQGERFNVIIDTISDMKSDTKESMSKLSGDVSEIKEKLSPLTHKIGAVDKLSGEVSDIKEKPARRWDDLVKQVIGLVVAALVGAVIVRLGL